MDTTVSLNFSLIKLLRISAPNLATMIQHVPDDAYLPTYKNLSTFATWPRIRHNRLLVVVPWFGLVQALVAIYYKINVYPVITLAFNFVVF